MMLDKSLVISKIISSGDGNFKKIVQNTNDKYLSKIETGRFELDGESHICISTQIGCNMACIFCNSTKPIVVDNNKEVRLIRNLNSGEILKQIENVIEIFPKPEKSYGFVFSFMGMGEPFDNIESVKDSIVKIGNIYQNSRISISTIGFNLNEILNFANEIKSNLYNLPIKLHFSLHASNDDIRYKIMPNSSPIIKTIEVAEKFSYLTKTVVKLNYVLIKGINDSKNDIVRLSSLLKGRNGLVLKISELNSKDKKNCVSRKNADIFELRLREFGLNTCRFFSLGIDIDGGCGEFIKNN